jgi:WD40 repeat protein
MTRSGECFDEEAALAYRDGGLSAEMRASMERHLNGCHECRWLLEAVACLGKAEPVGEESPASTARYSVLAEHARGGQARILLAFDENIGRQVALKEMLPEIGESSGGSNRQGSAERFLREAELTAKLAHPGVVPVFEIGRRPDGTPFYTMQMVRGRTLSEALRGCACLQDRLRLLSHFLSVCQVVAYAHSHRVVHRDIKSQNIMVGEFGETVLLDWGLAKQQGDDPERFSPSPRGPGESDATQDGTIMGTPGYMSPEQALGSPSEIDERSDIYGLGAVLFEILTGQPPAPTFGPAASASDARAVPRVRQLCADAPPELAAVVEKALATHKQDRYQQAFELAQEITAFMTGGRVAAYAYSRWDLMRRFAVRHRAAVAIFGVVLTALVLISAAWRSERLSRREAEASEEAATERGRDLLQEGAKLAQSQGDVFQARAKLRAALELGDSLAARMMWRRLREEPERFMASFGSRPFVAAFSPVDQELAVGLTNGDLELLDPVTRAARPLRGIEDQIFSLAYSPDGRLAYGAISGRIFLRERGQEAHAFLDGSRLPVYDLAFNRDGNILAVAHDGEGIVLWDLLHRARYAQAFPRERVTGLAFSPDGLRLLVSRRDGPTILWDVTTRAPVLNFSGGPSYRNTFSADGSLAIGASMDGNVYLWSVSNGALVKVLRGHRARVVRVAASRDGRWLASCSVDGTARVWSLPAGESVRVMNPTKEFLNDVAFSPDSSLLAAVGSSVWVWDLATPESPAASRPPQSLYDARFSPDGARIASAGLDGIVRLWERSSGELSASSAEHDGRIYDVCFTPDGALLVSVGQDGVLVVQDAETGSVRRRLSAGDRIITNVACSPDSRRVATAGSDGPIRVWDITLGKLERVLHEKHSGPISGGLVFTADGRRLATGRANGLIEIWDMASGRLLRALSGHAGLVFGLAFDLSGKTLASGGLDRTVRLWNVTDGTGSLLSELDSRVYKIGWNPHGQQLAVSTSSGEIFVWNLATRGPPLRIPAHHAEANSVAFAPDGRSAVSTGDDGVLRLWDTTSWKPSWFTRAVVWSPVPEILTHNGWRALDSSHQLAPFVPMDSAWRRAVETSREASMQPDGLVCLANEDGVEIWDSKSDRQLLTEKTTAPFGVAALPGMCSRHKDGRITLLRPSLPPIELDADVSFQVGGNTLILVGSEVKLFDSEGHNIGAFGRGEGVTAVAWLGDRMAVGFRNGSIELRRGQGGVEAIHFQETPASAVLRLVAGPSGTLVAGFADGSFGLWNASSGEKLELGALHGSVHQLLIHGSTLIVASEVGATATMDLSPLTDDYCDLLEEVRSRVPVIWNAHSAALQTPDSTHRCIVRDRRQ